MTPSIKHHYLPQFYLYGFTDADGFLYIYDKLKEKTWRTKPENAFFENHRNTGTLQYKAEDQVYRSDNLEQAYARIDSDAAVVFDTIRKSNHDDCVLTPERMLRVRHFINSMFWRSPANDELREQMLKSQSFKDLNNGHFEVVTEDGRYKPEEVYSDTNLLQKMYHLFLPFASFKEPYVKYNSGDWRLYYGGPKHGLIGDNPVIHQPFKDFASLHEEIIFKISARILLVSTKHYKPDVLSPLFSTRVDLILYQHAKRYVASSNQQYLQTLVALAKKQCLIPGWAEMLNHRTFSAFY